MEADALPIGFADLEADGHLDQFFVSADHQGRGVGSALIGTIIAEARRIGLNCIFVEASITARPFFESWGFAVLTQQSVPCRGTELVNFQMEKLLVGTAA